MQKVSEMKFELISPSILHLGVIGPMSEPVINQSSLDEQKNDLDRLTDELVSFGPEISLIEVHINSPGGSGPLGLGIYHLLVAHPAEKRVSIEGSCCSAATVVAMAGDSIEMCENGQFLIHEGKNVAIGTARDFFSAANALMLIDKKIRRIYRKRTGLSELRLKTIAEADTPMSAKEALALKFVDAITPPVENAEKFSPVKQLLDSKCLRCVFSLQQKKSDEEI